MSLASFVFAFVKSFSSHAFISSLHLVSCQFHISSRDLCLFSEFYSHWYTPNTVWQTDTDKGNFIHQHQHRFQHHTSYLSLFLHNQRLWWFWQICGVLNINITSYLYNRISVVLKNHVDWCQQNSRLSILSWCLQLPPSPPTDLDNIKVLQIQMQNKTNHEEIGGSAGSET